MTDNNATFQDAIYDMGAMFQLMNEKFGVPYDVTMDIVRLQLMYLQQQAQQEMIDAVAADEEIPSDDE